MHETFADVATTRRFKVDVADAHRVCLSYFGAASKPAHVRSPMRRLGRVMPRAKFLACFWMLGDDRDKVEEWVQAVGVISAPHLLLKLSPSSRLQNTAN